MSAIEQVQKAFSAVQALVDERDAAVHLVAVVKEAQLEALALAQRARVRAEQERDASRKVVADVIRTLGYGPHDDVIAAAGNVVRERDLFHKERDGARRECDGWIKTAQRFEARVSPECDRRAAEHERERLEVRNELCAGPDESAVQAAIRVIRERDAAVKAGAFASKSGLQQVLDDVRAALGSPSGSLTEHAARVLGESRRYFAELCEVSRVLGERPGSPRYASDVARDVVQQRDAAQKRADEWAQRCSNLTSLNAMARDILENARAHGWWTDQATGEPLDPIKRVPECLALIHSEVSEALETYRESDGSKGELMFNDGHHNPMTGVTKPVGFASELADVIIRVLDLSAALGIDIEAAIETKHAYNKTRPMRHGPATCRGPARRRRGTAT